MVPCIAHWYRGCLQVNSQKRHVCKDLGRSDDKKDEFTKC